MLYNQTFCRMAVSDLCPQGRGSSHSHGIETLGKSRSVVYKIRIYAIYNRNAKIQKNICIIIVSVVVETSLLTMLDSENVELVFAACGVLINLMVDDDKHSILQQYNGIPR